jgi:hypothetical protein
MRYIIGIDLGTTNCCVSYVDSESSKLSIKPFKILQLTAAGYIEEKQSLPSFCYLTTQQEWPEGALNLPWRHHQNHFVGHFALEQGAKVPTRLVQSAKSWLCHAAANRREKILPLEASDRSLCISPLEATAAYLKHIKDAWNYQIAQNDPNAEFESQDIVITVPASFDEVSRSLTIEAAKLAGLTKMSLLEEPQAAFYSWISNHESQWEKKLHPGNTILVCDVGGGTTDFSMMEVVQQGDKLAIQRMAVGDHLLLGGDNMDAAIAAYLENKLKNDGLKKELSTTQILQLRHESRNVKEKLLHPSIAQDTVMQVVLQGSGSNVISGSISTQISKQGLENLLLNGFFGKYTWEEAIQIKKARGLRTMGLPYEDDPSITKHLAYFLLQSNRNANPKAPDFVLFNGGTMKAIGFQHIILDSLKDWYPSCEIGLLNSESLDYAVGKGAAYYGKVRRGLGVRIQGGMARGYYLGIEVKTDQGIDTKALTLLPRGSEEDCEFQSEQSFLLTPNAPIAFHLYTSHTRLDDKPGDLIAIDPNEFQLLPPIHTVLRFGKQQEKIPVHLGIKLTAIGTLEIWLKSQKTDHRWNLELQLRNAEGQSNNIADLDKVRTDETFDASYINKAQKIISGLFSGQTDINPKNIMETLENSLDRPRRDWPISILRGLADTTLQQAGARKKSQAIEARWWNLIGFFLRPGFGYPLDDFKIKELWKAILSDSKTPKTLDLQIQNWICYRRIAGGLNKGQQTQIFSEIWPTLIDKRTGKIEIKNKSDVYPYSEKIRVIGALELLDETVKTKLGSAILDRIISKKACEADFWALGRIGARHLLYGSAINVLPKQLCEQWILSLIDKCEANDQLSVLIGQLIRKTDEISLNISQNVVDKVLVKFKDHPQKNYLQNIATTTTKLSQEEQEHSFGDRLPLGLTLEK